MAVIFDEMFVVFFAGKSTSTSRSSVPFAIAQKSDKPLIAQYFRTIADVDGLVNLGV